MIDYGTDYPDPLAEDGARLLDDVRSAVVRYCVLPSSETVDAVALWIAATHCLPAFDYAPRLVVRSAEKRSGKSRLLEVAAALVHHPLRVVNASVSYIFRSLGDDHPPSLLIDEADALFGTRIRAEQNEDLRGLLNAGYQRGLSYGRTVGPMHTPQEFSTFAMAALAGIGRMPDTIEDRAIVVQMRRRKPSESVQPYRRRRDEPALVALHDRLASWAVEHLDELTDAMPNLPIEDRAADTWEPLVCVADAAGGEWPGKARKAAEVLTAEADEHDHEASLNVRLLSDVRDVFTTMTVSFLPSRELVTRLCQLDDAPWRDFDLNPSKLGRRLSEYTIRTQRNTAGTARGYRLEDFHDAFERYLPATDPSEGVRSRLQADDQHKWSDALKPSDALKVSDDPKVSEQNRRSDPVLTPSDAFEHLPGKNDTCSSCGGWISGDQGHLRDCERSTSATPCPDCSFPPDSQGHATNCEGDTP